jgi:hypothetical protein
MMVGCHESSLPSFPLNSQLSIVRSFVPSHSILPFFFIQPISPQRSSAAVLEIRGEAAEKQAYNFFFDPI